MKRHGRTITVTGWFLAALGAMAIMSFNLVSCGSGGTNNNASPVSFSITGTVTAGSTGLADVGMTLSGAGIATAITDTSGNYAFNALANGSYAVTPAKTGYTFAPASSAQTVNGANITGADFTANANAMPTFSILGAVTSGGAGLAGATLTLSGSSSGTTLSDGGGNYSFSGLVNGSYTVTPSKSGFAFTPVSSPQTVSSANITGVDFTAASVLTVQPVACPGSGTIDIAIQNNFFSPAGVTVAPNSIVRWTNNGASNHTVTSTTVPANGSFDSSTMGTGTSVCFQFASAGTYAYHCAIHPSMTGSVTVQ